ncbi:MAG: hypothetical protein ACJ72H_18105 [Candidatus Sulfotelmatobacter sp.]|jgi:hypothetical protein
MTIINEVRKWLDDTGYPLEMRTASAFRAAGFEVTQSSYYVDEETSKAREMDVEAISISALGCVDVRFFVECKAGSKPWALLCSEDTLRNYNHFRAFGAMSGPSRTNLVRKNVEGGLINEYPWLTKHGVVAAYSIRQAFSGEKDTAYAAAMNVAKACEAHVSHSKYLNFAFPIIVIDAPLIQCTLDTKGEIVLQEVQEGEFLFTGHGLGPCIRILTTSRLTPFSEQAKVVARQLHQEFAAEEDNLLAEMEESERERGV